MRSLRSSKRSLINSEEVTGKVLAVVFLDKERIKSLLSRWVRGLFDLFTTEPPRLLLRLVLSNTTLLAGASTPTMAPVTHLTWRRRGRRERYTPGLSTSVISCLSRHLRTEKCPRAQVLKGEGSEVDPTLWGLNMKNCTRSGGELVQFFTMIKHDVTSRPSASSQFPSFQR